MGWGISGLSTISRGSKNYYFDGVVESIAMTKDDAFYLDGMRLIKLSETSTQIKYQSEQGYILATANLNGTVVKYFDVYFPNRTKGTYGYTTNSSTSYPDYPLTSLSDLYGNTVTYNYTYADNHYRISKISYTNASVEFSYATRPDILFSYTAGLKVNENQRLQSITCKYGSATLRTYGLNYTLQKDVSTLTSITYAGSDGSSFNPIKFYYGENNTAKTYSTTESTLIGNAISSPKIVKGKFDYESGIDGLIITENKDPYYLTSKGLINNYNGTEPLYIYTDIKYSPMGSTISTTTEEGFIDIFCANLDGSGGDEIIKVNNTVSGTNDHIVFTVYARNTMAGLYQKYIRTFDYPTLVMDNGGNKRIQPKFYYTGDFNGDGKMEVLAVSSNNPFGDTSRPTKCYLFDLESGTLLYQGADFQFQIMVEGYQHSATEAFKLSDRLFVGDFDGDGKTEIGLVNTNGTQIYKFKVSGSTYSLSSYPLYTGLKRGDLADRSLLMGELNGDGKPDFMLSPPTTNTSDINWSIFYSKGDGQFDKTTILAANNAPGVSFFLQDINGDGRSDLVKLQDNYQVLTYLSNDNSLYYLSDNVMTIPSKSIIVPFDVNGWNYNNQLITLNGSKLTMYSYNRNDMKEHLLTGMVTSLGVVNKNNYQMLYNSPSYTKGSGAEFPYDNFQGPFFVTESTEQYLNGQRNEYQTYRYWNAMINKQGRGFCGFEKIIAYDNIRTGRTLTQIYDPKKFDVLKSQESYLALDTLSYSISVATNKIAKVQMTNRYSLDKAKNVSLNHSYSNYDSYGNPQNETINYSDGITETVSSAYYNNTNETGYLLGFLIKRIPRGLPRGQTKETNGF
jgi:hypothetical protein